LRRDETTFTSFGANLFANRLFYAYSGRFIFIAGSLDTVQ